MTLASRLGRRFRRPSSALGWDGIVVLEDIKVAYIAIPKVANSTVKAVCAHLLADRLGDLYQTRWPPAPFRSADGKRALRAMGILITADELAARGDLEVFMLKRHPLDRLVSCWSSKIRQYYEKTGFSPDYQRLGMTPGMPFDQFVRRVAEVSDANAEAHFRSQASFFVDPSGRALATVQLELAEMPGCLADYLASKGAPPVEIPHLLNSKHEPWESFYDDETLLIARQRYRWDLEVLGYE